MLDTVACCLVTLLKDPQEHSTNVGVFLEQSKAMAVYVCLCVFFWSVFLECFFGVCFGVFFRVFYVFVFVDVC